MNWFEILEMICLNRTLHTFHVSLYLVYTFKLLFTQNKYFMIAMLTLGKVLS